VILIIGCETCELFFLIFSTQVHTKNIYIQFLCSVKCVNLIYVEILISVKFRARFSWFNLSYGWMKSDALILKNTISIIIIIL